MSHTNRADRTQRQVLSRSSILILGASLVIAAGTGVVAEPLRTNILLAGVAGVLAYFGLGAAHAFHERQESKRAVARLEKRFVEHATVETTVNEAPASA